MTDESTLTFEGLAETLERESAKRKELEHMVENALANCLVICPTITIAWATRLSRHMDQSMPPTPLPDVRKNIMK